jgi:hypothetical protein
MVRFYYDELWEEFILPYNAKFRYAVSNYGRIMSFTDSIKEGTLLKGSTVGGYKIFRYKIFEGKKIKNGHFFLHKLVATHFLKEKTDDQIYVLHLNHEKTNNHYKNLLWANKLEMIEHNKKSPAVIKAKQQLIETNINRKGHKLTATNVLLIKKKIFDPNRKTRMKMIAKQFGISEMQLYRIKSGENWGHIKVDELGLPLNQ